MGIPPRNADRSNMRLGNCDEKEDLAAPLLDEPEIMRKEVEGEEGQGRTVTSSRCITRRTSLLLHAILIALYTAILIAALISLRPRNSTKNALETPLWSPAIEHIEWETRYLDGLNRQSIYAGKPKPETDAAWHDLLKNMNLRILPHEIQNFNLTALEAVALADGSGFVGLLSVYHQLHCLKRIRWWLNRDYYYPDISTEDALARYDHVDHCIEMLRETAMCRSDAEVIPLQWAAYGGPSLMKEVPHRCVNWELLQEWAESRRVDLFDPAVLEEPRQPPAPS